MNIKEILKNENISQAIGRPYSTTLEATWNRAEIRYPRGPLYTQEQEGVCGGTCNQPYGGQRQDQALSCVF